MLHKFSLIFIFAVGLLFGESSALTKCQECTSAVDLLQLKWGEKTTEECFVDLVVFICDTFKIEDNDVCDYIVSDFADEFIYVLQKILITPHQICGLLMHNECGDFHDPLSESWTIPIPGNQPPFKPQQPVPAGKPTLKVLQLSDLHVDMHYTVGMDAQCDQPICCRPVDMNEEIVKNQADVKQPAGPWGTQGSCDTPYWLLTNMLQNIAKTQPDLDYVLVSGDVVSHAVWAYTQQTHAFMVRNLSDTIRNAFPTTPVYFAVGNHEGVPIDNFAPHFTPKKYHMDWLYNTMADSWKGWVPDDQVKTIKYNGCYMKKLYPGLRIISLNNAYGDRVNFWLYINQTDPDGTLNWLITQLSDAEKAGDKVHMLAHIPGADSEALEGYAINYYKIINRFANTVVAQFFGHTHSEKIGMLYSDPDNHLSTPTSFAYIAPSVTPFTEFFPAYRTYTIDGNYKGSSYQVIDYEEWFFNLTAVNQDPNNPQWTPLYKSANLEYGLKSQAPSEWNAFIERMKTDDDLFNRYRENHYRRSKYDGLGDCDQKCRNGFICNARQFHQTKKLCPDVKDMTPVQKRGSYTKRFRRPEGLKRRSNDQCKI